MQENYTIKMRHCSFLNTSLLTLSLLHFLPCLCSVLLTLFTLFRLYACYTLCTYTALASLQLTYLDYLLYYTIYFKQRPPLIQPWGALSYNIYIRQ